MKLGLLSIFIILYLFTWNFICHLIPCHWISVESSCSSSVGQKLNIYEELWLLKKPPTNHCHLIAHLSSCAGLLTSRHQLWSINWWPLCTVKTEHLFLPCFVSLNQPLIHFRLLCFPQEPLVRDLVKELLEIQVIYQISFTQMLAESSKEVLWFWDMASLYRRHIDSFPGYHMYPHIHRSCS